MNNLIIKTLEDIEPHVTEYLLPHIQQAVEVCVNSFLDDEFNDTWTFGTQLWKNIWNRFKTVAEFEDCPFELSGKGNEYKLKIGPFIVRHHRVDKETQLPKSAKAAKSAATAVQMSLFANEWDVTIEKDNIVIAISANTDNGLEEIFIGELIPHSFEPNKFKWANKVPVYLAEGVEPSKAEILQIKDISGFEQFAPEEVIPEIRLDLDESKKFPKEMESNGKK